MIRPLLALLLSLASFSALRSAETKGVLVISIVGDLTERQSLGIVGQVMFPPDSIHTLVLVVDSDRGALPDILAIADALARAPVRTCAYVKNAVGPAVFIVASCQLIVTDVKGVIGGPGVIPREYFVLSDQLFSAAREELTTKLKDCARARGHDADIFSAMIDPKQRLVRAGKEWKGVGQILTMTAREMVTSRLADSSWGSVEEFVDAIYKRPNQALEPTTPAVTPRAPSSTSRASRGRGSS